MLPEQELAGLAERHQVVPCRLTEKKACGQWRVRLVFKNCTRVQLDTTITGLKAVEVTRGTYGRVSVPQECYDKLVGWYNETH